ncbi:MAG: tetratricopeptide repeat protein, partial [Planctomycetes bacterium]|nr:tetratricopeptide repeat protein [Planctomycetota bacterium]
PAHEYLHKAQDLEKQGMYLDAANLYGRAVQAEKENPTSSELNLVTEINLTGYCYLRAGQYGKAIKFFEEALALAEKLGNEDIVADCFNYFGLIYKSVEKYEKAIKYYKNAIDIAKNLGMKDKIALMSYNISEVYKSWDKHNRAIEYIEDALEIEKELGMKDKVAVRLNNIGEIYNSLGQYDKAIEYYEVAIAISRDLPGEKKTSTYLNNIGSIYEVRDQYEKAIEYYEEALAVNRDLRKEDKVVICLNNLGRVSEIQGQYDKATGYYEEASTISRDTGKEGKIETYLGNLGRICETRGQYEKAIKYYNEALALSRERNKKDRAADYLNTLGTVYKTQNHYDKAIEFYEQALDLDIKLRKEADDARISKELDMVYTFYWSKHEKVIRPYEEALAINKRYECDIRVINDRNNLGVVYILQNNYKTAIKYFSESISIIEKVCKSKLFKRATGEDRKNFFTAQSDTYQWLTCAYAVDNDIFPALKALELSRAKSQAERFQKYMRLIIPPDIRQIQKTLGEDTIIISYTCVGHNDFLLFAVTSKEISCKGVPGKSFIRSVIDKYNTSLRAFLINQRGFSRNKSNLDNIINYYVSLLKAPLSKAPSLQTSLPENTDVNKSGEIGRGLYEFLIRPVEAQIKDKKNLIIIPDGNLAFVPFETLLDENEQYLIENYNISYVQSMYMRELINNRTYSKIRKPLLAFGGAIYNKGTFNVDVIENDLQLSNLKRSTYYNLDNKIPVRNSYSALGFDTWPDIPDTINEVNSITRIFNNSNFFTGRNVTESHIKELSQNGTLDNYKVLHFATQGIVVPDLPKLSALVLSQSEKWVGSEDGYLLVDEIAKLELKADFICLSACEAGPGNVFGSDGFMGLTQSFLLAGAKAVSVSLWRVPDESTSRFMVSMYDMVKSKDIGYAKAITEVKRDCIRGDFGEKYKAPYYWAPFVYYGE